MRAVSIVISTEPQTQHIRHPYNMHHRNVNIIVPNMRAYPAAHDGVLEHII